MNSEFRQSIWKGLFKPTENAVFVEEKLSPKLGLTKRYEAAQLMVGRSLVEPKAPLPVGDMKTGKPIPGENLFGEQIDLWISILIMDGQLGIGATLDDFRGLVEAHWARGAELLLQDWEHSREDHVLFARRLAELLPERVAGGSGRTLGETSAGQLILRVGAVSLSYPAGEAVAFELNGPATSPHIALMGRSGSGKTTTGVNLVGQIIEQSAAPFLFIDPKGEFVEDGAIRGAMADMRAPPNGIEVGVQPIPLDFSPDPAGGRVAMQNAARQLCDTVAKCCRSVGDVQRARLLRVIEGCFSGENARDFPAIAEAYRNALSLEDKQSDSISSLLDSLSTFGAGCFSAQQTPAEFFSKSWVISLKKLPDDLRKLSVLVLLDAVKTHLRGLKEAPLVGRHRALRHLLVLDEARKFLRETRSESLVEIVREMRSKGSCVILLSQDPSDFEGETDDFTTQLGTVIGFSCNQSRSGLRALRGVFGRALQESEFSDSTLPSGVAFCKLPGRPPERIVCWKS